MGCHSVGRSGEDESQEDVLMDEAPSNISQTSTLQANREGMSSPDNEPPQLIPKCNQIYLHEFLVI